MIIEVIFLTWLILNNICNTLTIRLTIPALCTFLYTLAFFRVIGIDYLMNLIQLRWCQLT